MWSATSQLSRSRTRWTRSASLETVQQVLAQSAALPPPDAVLPITDADEDPYTPPFAVEMEDLRVLAASDDPKFRTLVRNAFIVDYPSVTVFDAADRAEALAIIERRQTKLVVAEKVLRESLGEIAEGELPPNRSSHSQRVSPTTP